MFLYYTPESCHGGLRRRLKSGRISTDSFNIQSFPWVPMEWDDGSFLACILVLVASLHVCVTTVKRPHFSVWLLHCSWPVSGGRVHRLRAALRTHLSHIVPGSGSSLKLALNWGGWVWISVKHLRKSRHQQRKRTKDTPIADLHRTAEAPRESTVIADANNKFTVLCCTLSTTLLLVLLTSHYIAQNYSITSLFFFQYDRVIVIMCVDTNRSSFM